MSDTALRILMLASENDAIPGAKVGGIGDVLRDIPRALARAGHQVHVVIPAYGLFHLSAQATRIGIIGVRFRQQQHEVALYRWTAADDTGSGPQPVYWLLEHELFSAGGAGQIYCDDPDWAPFESDANKFALFCQACAEAIASEQFGPLDVIHLHDWHAAFYALLREYDSRYQSQKQLRCVFTLHNLALQGIRPLDGNDSSLNAWYPWLPYDPQTVSDPRWPTCVNPIACALRLCDKTHTVSPSYATEIQRPNACESSGFHGGEGLEEELQQLATQGRLEGILNGCDYSGTLQAPADWNTLLATLNSVNQRWLVRHSTLHTSDYLADRTLQRWQAGPTPAHIITSIGRLTGQKVSLLAHRDEQGQSTLQALLASLGDTGVFILLGTGDTHYEQFFTEVAAQASNFLFLNHFDQSVAELLYASGKLFLMPSSFEPCGISQMLAMKYGQPCLVHAVGGLKDTVEDNVSGFHFSGDTLATQAVNLRTRFAEALALAENDSGRWQQICDTAASRRFEWDTAAAHYTSRLYQATQQ